jgi:hypothetical protein
VLISLLLHRQVCGLTISLNQGFFAPSVLPNRVRERKAFNWRYRGNAGNETPHRHDRHLLPCGLRCLTHHRRRVATWDHRVLQLHKCIALEETQYSQMLLPAL